MNKELLPTFPDLEALHSESEWSDMPFTMAHHNIFMAVSACDATLEPTYLELQIYANAVGWGLKKHAGLNDNVTAFYLVLRYFRVLLDKWKTVTLQMAVPSLKYLTGLSEKPSIKETSRFKDWMTHTHGINTLDINGANTWFFIKTMWPEFLSPTDWQLIEKKHELLLKNLLEDIKKGKDNYSMQIQGELFDANKEYSNGDIVSYAGKTYISTGGVGLENAHEMKIGPKGEVGKVLPKFGWYYDVYKHVAIYTWGCTRCHSLNNLEVPYGVIKAADTVGVTEKLDGHCDCKKMVSVTVPTMDEILAIQQNTEGWKVIADAKELPKEPIKESPKKKSKKATKKKVDKINTLDELYIPKSIRF